MATHSLFLPGQFHGQRSLVGCRLWGHKESDMRSRDNQPPDSTLTLPLPDAEEAVLCSLETGTQFYLIHSHVIPASNLVSGT